MSVLPLMLIIYVGSGSPYSEAYDEPPLPYISAEALGGETGEWYEVRDLTTPLFGRVRSVGETPYVERVNDWWQYSTEVDFFAPAKPLTRELRDYFMGSGAQTLSLDGFDEAYYAKNAFEDAQFLLLRRGGEVLYFRTAAGDDLREHLEEFAELFDQYAT